MKVVTRKLSNWGTYQVRPNLLLDVPDEMAKRLSERGLVEIVEQPKKVKKATKGD